MRQEGNGLRAARAHEESPTFPAFANAESVRLVIHMMRGTADTAYPPTRSLPLFRAPLRQAHALAVLGSRLEAQSIVQAEIQAARSVGAHSSVFIALVYITLGDNDSALDWLQQAVDDGLAAGTVSLNGPLLDPVRSDPRFAAIRDQMGFPQ